MISPDAFVRDRIYQKIADRVNERWDRACFWLAAQAGTVFGVTAVMRMVTNPDAREHPVLALVGVTFVGYLWFVYHHEAARKHHAALRAAPYADSVIDSWFRVYLLLFMLAVDLPVAGTLIAEGAYARSAIDFAESLAWVSCRYFMACRLNPPRRKTAPRSAMLPHGVG